MSCSSFDRHLLKSNLWWDPGEILPTALPFMSDLSNPSVITPSTLENGTDKGSAITMASSLGVQPRPEDSQGLQVEPLADVVDTKNTALGCTPISMLATAASSDMLGLGADKREASAVLEGEVSSDFKSRDEHLAVRPSFAGKASHKLQLPSFENLGIASPHPDYVCPRRHIFDPFNPLPHHTGLGIRRFPNISNHDHLRPIQGSSYLLTPPDDSGTINWKTSARTFTDNSQKVPSSGSETMAAHQGVPMVNATNSDGGRSGPSSSPPDDRRGDATMGGGCGQTVPPTADGDNSGGHSLLEEAIGITGSEKHPKTTFALSSLTQNQSLASPPLSMAAMQYGFCLMPFPVHPPTIPSHP